MRAAAKEYGWNLNYGGIALHVARRLHHPQRASSARSRRPSTGTRASTNLLLDPYFAAR